MAILGIPASIGQVAKAGAAPKVGAQKFADAMKGAAPKPPASAAQRTENAALLAQPGRVEAKGQPAVAATKSAATTEHGVKALDHVMAAQNRMEKVLELAQSGKNFTPAELLSLQSQVYRASQELDLAGKVVEKATGGVKQVLQTQL